MDIVQAREKMRIKSVAVCWVQARRVKHRHCLHLCTLSSQLKNCSPMRQPVVVRQKTHGGAMLEVVLRALLDGRAGDLAGGETAVDGYARSPLVIASRL